MQPGAKSFAISYFDQLDLTQDFSKNPQAFQLYLALVTRFLNCPMNFEGDPLISFTENVKLDYYRVLLSELSGGDHVFVSTS